MHKAYTKHYNPTVILEETYALWSMHSTTFPKAPSPKVSTISSKKEKSILVMPRSGNDALTINAINADYSTWCYKFPYH